MLVLACCRLQNISLCGTTTALSHHSQRQDCVGQILIIISLCNTSLQVYFFFNCTDSVRRKIMVLDLDETLIHSHHDGALTVTTPLTPPDFIVRVSHGGRSLMVDKPTRLKFSLSLSISLSQVKIENHPVRFFVHKRPHVDFFLSLVCTLHSIAHMYS